MTEELKKANLELIERFLNSTRTDNTEISYRSDLINFLESVDKSLLDVDIDDINYYFNKVLIYKPNNTDDEEKEKYKPRSKNRKIASLNKFYKYLLKKKLVEDNPLEGFERFKVDTKEETKILTKQEVDKLLKHIKMKIKNAKSEYQRVLQIRNYALVTLLIKTGMRIEECLPLTPKEFKIETCEIYLVGDETKGKVSRTLYFNEKTKRIVQDYLEVRDKLNKNNLDYIFLSDGGKKMTTNSANELLQNYGESCDPPIYGITNHKCRHYFAITLYNKYKDLNLVKTALGHSSIETTMLYIHESTDVEKMRNL